MPIKPIEKINIFKPFLNVELAYKGGPSLKTVSANGKKVYKLSSNENPIGSSPKAIKAMQNNLQGLHLYPDNTDLRFRTALSDFYDGQLKVDQFLTAMSGSEVLELIIRAFLDPGLECILSNPSFMPYSMFSQRMGAKVIDIPLKQPDYALDIDGILTAITDNTRLIFLTSPNNPTGTYIPKKTLTKLINKVPEHVVIVLDEVYYQFADASDFTTALPYVKKRKNVIGLNSFSKAYGLAGMRLGYAYGPAKIMNYIRQLAKPFMVNTLCMEAGMAALKDKAFLNKTIRLIHKEKKFIYKHLDKIGIRYWKTQGNFFLIDPAPMSDDVFTKSILKEGIMVRPVTNFGAPGLVRITIGTRDANTAFLKGLEQVMKSL